MRTEEQKKKISEEICKIREMSGLSQGEFAREIGVTRQTISSWEKCEKSPRLNKIKKICERSGIKYEDFLKEIKDIKEESETQELVEKNNKNNRNFENKLIEASNKNKAIEEKFEKYSLEKNQNALQIINKKFVLSKVVNLKAIFKILFILTIIIVVIVFHVSMGIAKFAYLKKINTLMQNVKNLDNYYFAITNFVGNKWLSTKYVWYLDGKYKIDEMCINKENNGKNNEQILYVDTYKNTEAIYTKNGEKLELKENKKIGNDIMENMYENGELLYHSLPRITTENDAELLKIAFHTGFIKIKNVNNEKIIDINNQEIVIDKNTQIPIKGVNNTKIKDLNNPSETITFIETKLNCVKREDVEVGNID